MTQMIFSLCVAMVVFGLVGMALCSLEWLVILILDIITREGK